MSEAGAAAGTTVVVRNFWYDDPDRPRLTERRRRKADIREEVYDVSGFFLPHYYLHSEEVDEETGLLLPAHEAFRRDGTLAYCAWFFNGKHHRAERDPETGIQLPAVQHFNREGTVVGEEWNVEGEHFRIEKEMPTRWQGTEKSWWYRTEEGMIIEDCNEPSAEYRAYWEEQYVRLSHYFDPAPVFKSVRKS